MSGMIAPTDAPAPHALPTILNLSSMLRRHHSTIVLPNEPPQTPSVAASIFAPSGHEHSRSFMSQRLSTWRSACTCGRESTLTIIACDQGNEAS